MTEKENETCSYCGLDSDRLWTSDGKDYICIDCIVRGMKTAKQRMKHPIAQENTPEDHYKERLKSCQQLNRAYIEKIKEREEHHKTHHAEPDKPPHKTDDYYKSALSIAQAHNNTYLKRIKNLKNDIDIVATSLRDANNTIVSKDGMIADLMERIGRTRKVLEKTAKNLTELRAKGISRRFRADTDAYEAGVSTASRWRTTAEIYKKEWNEYKNYNTTLRRQVTDLHKTINNKELEIAAAIAAGKLKDAIDTEILEGAIEKAKCSPLGETEQPQASGAEGSGYKNTCPDCGKVWRTAIPYNEKQTCIKCTAARKHAREAGNICPSCKKVNHNRSAKHNPMGLCPTCFQSKSIEVDLIIKPNHYTWHPSGVECKDIVSEFNYNKGTAIAYIWRSEHKGTEKADIKKAIQHLQFELDGMGDNGDGR